MTKREAKIIALRIFANEALQTIDSLGFNFDDKYSSKELNKIADEIENIGISLRERAEKLEETTKTKR